MCTLKCVRRWKIAEHSVAFYLIYVSYLVHFISTEYLHFRQTGELACAGYINICITDDRTTPYREIRTGKLACGNFMRKRVYFRLELYVLESEDLFWSENETDDT
jgi:hypothetical protein